MRKFSDFLDKADRMFATAAERGVLLQDAEDEAFDGRTIRLGGSPVLHFGSCSYLGLELDPRLQAGAIDAITRYGTQFSASRAAASAPLYAELEALLTELFGIPALVAPTTTLAHATALPILVDERDLVVRDQQVHASVTVATNHLLVQGTQVEVLRHNRLDQLEERIAAMHAKGRRLWYLADGVYSMFGDLAPMAELARLLDRWPNFHLYVDDAHGMSWTGTQGRGHALTGIPGHPRMVVATSLNKAFAAGGGALLVPDATLRRRLRSAGAAFVFSGPLQPASLGAGIASAKLHLNGEVEARQAQLRARIARWNALCADAGLPQVSAPEVPIRFIGAGRPEVAYAVAERLKADGVYPTLSVFPTVPMTKAGLRFALTTHLTDADLARAVELLAHHLPRELARAGSSLAEVHEAFDLGPPTVAWSVVPAAPAGGLALEHHRSVADLDTAEWDRLLGDRGTFSAAGLAMLEAAFAGDWAFHYFLVRDAAGVPVLATFFTEAPWKLDLLAPAEVSRAVEARRQREPGFLVARTLGMGSMLTEGDHLWLDRAGDWRGALALLLRTVERLAGGAGAELVALRDLPADDPDLDACLQATGFVGFPMPESLVLDLADADAPSANARKHQRKKVRPFDGFYDVEVVDAGTRRPDAAELAGYHALYRAVADRNLAFNAELLPDDLLATMLDHPGWELLLLRLKPEHGGEPGAAPVAFMAGFRGRAAYTPLICGLDYRYVETHGAYRQLLRHGIARARELGYDRLYFGFGAEHEKTRYGCKPRRAQVYLRTADTYPLEVLSQLLKRA